MRDDPALFIIGLTVGVLAITGLFVVYRILDPQQVGVTTLKRPMKDRIWFTKPQWYWFGWRTLIPYSRGGDEFMWHCYTFGWTITGRVNIALKPCPGEKCSWALDDDELEGMFGGRLPVWPVDGYGHNWIKCERPGCYCQDDEEEA